MAENTPNMVSVVIMSRYVLGMMRPMRPRRKR